MGHYEKQSKKRMPLWYYLVVLLLLSVFAVSAWQLADYYIGSRKQSQAYDELASLVDSAYAPETEAMPEDPDTTVETGEQGQKLPKIPAKYKDIRNEEGILLEYAPLYEQNPDMAGWLKIEGTRVNYPVMHTPDRTDYYLKRGFDKKYSDWGCLYAREECSITEPSDNVIIYGHNMNDGSMLAALHSYMDKSFWDEHSYIRFDTLSEHHTYRIFAVFVTSAYREKGFGYHNFINAANEEEFDEFISQCLALSKYDTGIVPTYGDKIICLSTCEYSQINGRLVVAAVRIY